ncbi:MAG TPA: arginine--tRNA ligase, partial [Candidatus Paceibacterota bacterium]|nr:arginine--tRNA ligase [Candidatus Paceibacterota bacterium]
ANEQNDYFRVVLKALEIVEPEAAKVTKHISHGMLRFAEGKMSSRKGNVITGESLVKDVEKLAFEKLKDRDMDEKEKRQAAEMIAVAAIKYSILKQVSTSDIIYDFDKSISFEGDSGPYLLYTAVRAASVLEKAKKEGVKASSEGGTPEEKIERLVARFPETVSRAAAEKAPHLVTTHLVELSSAFNSWYANVPIVDPKDPGSPYKVALTQAVRTVLANGLKLLGIRIPERM